MWSGVGSFTSHENQISVSAVRRDLRFSSLSEKIRKSNRSQMSLQRQHFLLSYLKTLSIGPVGIKPETPPSADQRSPNWANQATHINRKWALLLFLWLEDNKFVLQSVFSYEDDLPEGF